MNRNLFVAILAIVCVVFASVTSVEACDKCRSGTSTSGYSYSSSSGYSYAYVSRPVYTIRYCFSDCDEVCYVPAPKPKCEIKELGLQRYDTHWCQCGCRKEFTDKYNQIWRTDSKVASLGAEIVGWRYDVVDADGVKHHYYREAKLVDGEWVSAGRLWHYAGDK